MPNPFRFIDPMTRWARVGKHLPTEPMAAAQQINRYITPMRYTGGAAGAMAGYQSGDENLPEGERLLRTAAGGLGGGLALPGMARTAMMAKNFPELAVNGMYYSYLSSPDTIARANLGAAGGALINGLEQLVAGNVGAASKTLGAVVGGAKVWTKSLMGSPQEVRALRREILGPEASRGRLDIPDETFRDVGLGKWFTAGDNAGVYIMKKAGLSPEEAMRFTLAGTPETALGKSLVGTQSQWLRGGTAAQRIAAATFMPFARVGVVGMEQGLKRIPGIGMFKGVGGPGWGSLAQLGGPKTAARDAARLGLARQAVGGGVMGAGASSESAFDPRASLTASTITGPAFLPYTLGREFKRQLQRTTNLPAAGLGAFGEAAMEFSPMGFQPLGALRRPEVELPRRLVPGAVADIAEMIDPAFGRKQGRGELQRLAERGEVPDWMAQPGVGATLARLPGMRGRLPEEYAPVDIFGRPRFKRPEVLAGADQVPLIRGLSRVLTPSRVSAFPPAQNLQDPQMRQLYEMGIRPGPPSQRVQMPITGQDIRLPAGAVSQVQALRGSGRERTAQIMSQLAPWLMTLPPPQRMAMARYLSAMINQSQGQALQAGSLALALRGGGQAPQF